MPRRPSSTAAFRGTAGRRAGSRHGRTRRRRSSRRARRELIVRRRAPADAAARCDSCSSPRRLRAVQAHVFRGRGSPSSPASAFPRRRTMPGEFAARMDAPAFSAGVEGVDRSPVERRRTRRRGSTPLVATAAPMSRVFKGAPTSRRLEEKNGVIRGASAAATANRQRAPSRHAMQIFEIKIY